MLAGPSIATCYNSPDGMGLCLRGKMADAGILPKPPAAVVAETPVAAEPPTAIAEPQLDVAPPAQAPAAPAENLIAATFGLLRAEPDGSVVIAGSGTPGSEVEVYSNGDLLGKAKVEASGDWVLVPDAPIPPGGTELTLGEAGKPGRAAESFVVAVNPDKTSEPLVVASTPGSASEVLQGLTPPAAGTATTVASADPQPALVAPPAVTPPAATSPAVTPPTAEAAAPPVAAAPTPPAAAPAVTPPAPAEPPAPGAVAPEVAMAQPAAPAATAPQPNVDVAVAQPPVATPVPPAPGAEANATPPTIDAIEVEGQSSFFAGSGPEGGVVRLYIDDTFISDATVAGGRWLVEAGNVLTRATQRIRVDLLKTGSAEVAARAEVDFKLDVPAEAPTAVAATAPPAAQANPAPAEVAPAPTESVAEAAPGPEATSTPEPAAPVATPAPEPDVAETPAPVEPVAPAVEASAPETQVAEQTPEPAPVAEGEVPTMQAVAVGDPELARFAAGKAIIRRGDNLWTIARRVYGAGIKYTTIYQANTGQIRNPDRIYPGQVFNLPDTKQ